MFLKIIKLNENAITPTLDSNESGYDIYVLPGVSEIINPHCNKEIRTGLAVEIPKGYIGLIFARHNLSVNEGLRPANCVGHITSDYRGELTISLHNQSKLSGVIQGGERIAKLIIMPYLAIEGIKEVSALRETNRGTSGFGSTGK